MNFLRITDKHKSKLIALLQKSNLPESDIKIDDKHLFFGSFNNINLTATIGIEIYGTNALLRSLAVVDSERGNGLGKAMVKYLEDYSKDKNIKKLFLLTNTAEKFFLSIGYKICDRKNAPKEIKSTAQFSDLCPSSSSFMTKSLI